VLVVLSFFLALNWFRNSTTRRQFYVGVEYAYGDQVSEVITLVDKVENFTNLFVLGSVGLTFNRTALTEACDYILNAKLNFIVLFTGLEMYSYNITQWIVDAKLKYGEKFFGIYRYDEPGGNQLDNGTFRLINTSSNYSQVAKNYVGNLSFFTKFYLDYAPQIFTSDYGLYWFDYKSNYSNVFAEFVGNQSRQRHIALCRGAAEVFNRDWGVIITWKYDQKPYLELKDELYNDLTLAYSSGAKYVVVFSYPNIGTYGTLTDEHFETLQKFWDTLKTDPDSFGTNEPEVAYVLPADYGFGFRNSDDVIWGLFPADERAKKIYDDVVTLLDIYGARLNIFYDEQEILRPFLHNYNEVFYWNKTINKRP